jgi:cation transport ATPase
MVIDAKQPASATQSSRVGVSWGPQTIRLRDEEVFGTAGSELCGRFLLRVFSVEEVRSVQIDRPQSTAVIRYERGTLGTAELLQRVAAALRGTVESAVRPQDQAVSLLPQDLAKPRLTIYRHHGLLSTWEVVGHQPGLLCLRHEIVTADSALARRIAHHVESVHGVLSSVVRPWTGILKIRFDPAQTRAERLLRALESAPEALPIEVAVGSEPVPVQFGLVNTAVALSVVSDFVVPSVWPATAALLVGSNLKMFREAAVQLGRGQLGLPVLYTTIAAGTLATGQFLPWAAMNWMLRLWKQQYQQQLTSARRRLLGEVVQQQRFARIEAAGGVEVDVPVERLAPGDMILVSAGEKLGVDGRIVKGHGLIDERVVRGALGMTRKGPDEAVHAGSIVLSGDFQVETRRQGTGTRAATLARTALTAASHTPGTKTPTLKGERFASRVVGPMLATAGLGFSLGGAPTALAILDTDFASGPGLAIPLDTLQALSICYQQGIVVRDPEAIDRLAKVDVLFLDHHPALESPEPEVASVRVFPGHTEFQMLRYAASALRDLDDERAGALRAACRSRRITLLDRIPTSYGTDLTLNHRGQVIKVGNLGGQGPEANPSTGARGKPPARPIDSLMVGINGQIAGLIDFRSSSRLLAATALQELRAKAHHPLAIGLVSESDEPRIRQLATSLGVDFHHGGLSTNGLVQLIRGCHKRGLKVAYAGECLVRGRAAREADVAISLDADGLENLDRNPAQLLLLQPDLARLGVLHEVTRIHRRRVLVAQGSAWIPNLFCVAGAFFLGFSSLTTVAITNLGTYSTYARTTAAIRGLERQLARVSRRRVSEIAN